jgi:hypothetical protein
VHGHNDERYRFGACAVSPLRLRNLLIATTLLAVVLGVTAWAGR